MLRFKVALQDMIKNTANLRDGPRDGRGRPTRGHEPILSLILDYKTKLEFSVVTRSPFQLKQQTSPNTAILENSTLSPLEHNPLNPLAYVDPSLQIPEYFQHL